MAGNLIQFPVLYMSKTLPTEATALIEAGLYSWL